jgi:hypothetical protein
MKMKKAALAIMPVLFVASIVLGCTSGCGSKKEAVKTSAEVTHPSGNDLQESPAMRKIDDSLSTGPTATTIQPKEKEVVTREPKTEKPAATEPEKKEVATTEPKKEAAAAKPAGGSSGQSKAAEEPTAKENVADTSQRLSVDKLPDVVMMDRSTIEQHAAKRDPRLGYLRITGLKVAEDGKTVEFNVENTFDRPNAEPLHIGELMLTGVVRFDYDNGAALHNCVLYKEKRMEFRQGPNPFKTDPEVYPHVTKIEGLQFFITPAELSKPVAATGNIADTSQEFSVDSLPDVIMVDQNTIEQHAVKRDPRLGYLRITGLKVAEDGRTVKFCIENTFEQVNAEPIHIPGLVLSGIGRFDYDGGAALRTCVLLKEKRLTCEKGSKCFETDPETYPHVTKIEGLQFFFTP